MPFEPARPALERIGNYDLVEKIAEGGMGTVYKGRHRVSGDIVAVKVVAPHMISNNTLLKRFAQEYNAARKFDHPNIVRAIEYNNDGGTPYLVMEFVDGESLGQKLQREGVIAEKEAIRIIAQVAQGLFKAHKEKLVHRDVKPDNIMLTSDGQAKLTDLGLVKEVDADLNLTKTGRGLGTPHFMAPEQFKDAKNADPRCDIYSLGATLYMMVTGEMPFKSSGPLDAYMKKLDNSLTSPRELQPQLSERLDWAIRRSMSADRDKRPSDCREFVEDLTGRSTKRPTKPDEQVVSTQDIWYMVYQDEEANSHTVKGTTAAIRRSLKENLLGDASNIRASRTKENFLPLNQFPEFRDLVIEPAPIGLQRLQSKQAKPAQNAMDSPSTRSSKPTPVSNNTPGATTQAHPLQQKQATSPTRNLPEIPLRKGKPSRNAGVPLWVQMLIVLALVTVGLVLGYVFRK